jgi:MbtH protein
MQQSTPGHNRQGCDQEGCPESTEGASMFDEDDEITVYKVVMNHEEQYSIWPAERETPNGWREVGKTGTKSEVLNYIKDVWTDMRPLSLRKWMAEQVGR